MFQTIADIFRQRDLRRQILITVGLLGVFRLGTFLPIPFLDYTTFNQWFTQQTGAMGNILSMFSIITAGSLSRATLFSLGVMPYISASIIIQMLSKVVPALKAIYDEGAPGRRRLNQYTRYLTIAIAVVQSFIACLYLANIEMGGPAGATIFTHSRGLFILTGVLTITTGSMVLMWIGEQITQFGIGNGVSLIIMVDIVARIPLAFLEVSQNLSFSPDESGSQLGIGSLLVLAGLVVVILFSVVYIYLGRRMIPVQYGRQMRGQKQALWLRVNQAGVIPVIFASALMTAPQVLAGLFGLNWFDYYSFEYILGTVVLIVFFTFFYTAMLFNPEEMAENLKENGSFIPGYRAGRKTAEFLHETLIYVTFMGAIFLAVVAVLPTLVGMQVKTPFVSSSSLFGGTAMLIVIGVSLDLMQKIQQHFYMRDYGGFLRTKLKGRRR
ncbi:MAG: preprotein translocase subunit SecY [Planctomycetota bacterium]